MGGGADQHLPIQHLSEKIRRFSGLVDGHILQMGMDWKREEWGGEREKKRNISLLCLTLSANPLPQRTVKSLRGSVPSSDPTRYIDTGETSLEGWVCP